MKILYVSAIDSNQGWGAEVFLNQAFNELGHETICLDYRTNRGRMYEKLLAAPDFDVFLLQRGDGFPVELVELIDRPTFFYDSELPYRLDDHGDLVRSGVFDRYSFWCQNIIDDYAAKGWVDPAKCSVLNGAFHPPLHRKLPGTAKNIEVLLIASMTPRRTELAEKISRHIPLTRLNAFGQDMVQAINRAKIVLNLHATDYAIAEIRVHEVLGCQSFLLTERLPDCHPYASGEDLVEFFSLEELYAKVEYYLANQAEREAIAAKGHQAAMGGNTMRHLAQRLIDIFQQMLDAKG
jgi:spore maturation protein CgeB